MTGFWVDATETEQRGLGTMSRRTAGTFACAGRGGSEMRGDRECQEGTAIKPLAIIGREGSERRQRP